MTKKAPTSLRPADIKQKVAEYLDLESPAKQLALLEWMAALEPAQRKHLRYPHGGGLLVPESLMSSTRFLLAASLFAKEDRKYWAQHDPAASPWVPNTTLGDAMDPSQRAIEAATKTWQPKKDKGHPDYAEAKRMLEAIAADESSGVKRDATHVLAVIALREGQPKQVFARLGIEQGEVPRDNALYAGAAYFALGDVERALACYTGSDVNQGFLAEARGDFAAADRFYRAGLEASWWAVRPYAKLRCARLEQRLGKRELERLRASDHEGKIVLEKLAEFHAQFPAIADALRESLRITSKKQPLSDAEIDEIRLATKRSGDGGSVGLPESAKTILRYDRNFTLFENATPLLAPLLKAAKKGATSVDVEKLVRSAVRQDDSTGLRALSKLPKDVPLWNDAADLPACIELASPGDQELFLYMGVADADGEYPVARFDDQPELWISDASLVHYILDAANDVVECKIDLVKAKKAAQKRNARHREGWSAHPKVQAVLAKV